jgi:hypothetical protein
MLFLILASFGAAAASPTDVRDAVWQRLILRDGVSCASLFVDADAVAVRDALLEHARSSARPSYAPMRAASCAIELAATDPVAFEAAKVWMTDAAVPGLALLVVQNLDVLAEPQAVEVAELAVQRIPSDERFALYARPALTASAHPAVRDVAARLEVASQP